ncbi:MAG: phosphoribosylformylglycinamidine cyclo-ligase [Firmicutes bacterium HGW-Firmicutes-11]|jgi:phosphoribosylformylglycinamidine cyclo-ligase|nr:MAG: phosphoribosylformylglycinamidine cyclo-ligase [Firmicutes bacterium HGW-Firmicutes-11]
MKSSSEFYKQAGVDIEAGYESVSLMKAHVNRTVTSEVIGGIGGFGGMVAPDLTGMKQPVLVSGTDGVGTKLRIAFLMDQHDTIGIDCVAMCVNDIICCGARPLFFLDYLAVGSNIPERVASIVSGVAEGCVLAGCALVGGETAEMPGFYQADEYDIAGFAVGIADKDALIDGRQIVPGDLILSLPSSGIHSNGYSLVRNLFRLEARPLTVIQNELSTYHESLGATLGDTLLTPTRIYVKPILTLLKSVKVKGIAHITGGGFFENLPRILPDGCSAFIERSALVIPPIFSWMQHLGSVPEREMFNVFNMGTGLCLVIREEDADQAIRLLSSLGESPSVIGRIVAGEREVVFC